MQLKIFLEIIQSYNSTSLFEPLVVGNNCYRHKLLLLVTDSKQKQCKPLAYDCIFVEISVKFMSILYLT